MKIKYSYEVLINKGRRKTSATRGIFYIYKV